MKITFALLFMLAATQVLWAQPDSEQRQRVRHFLVQRFDKDGNGRLSTEERATMRRFLEERRGQQASSKSPTLTGLYGQSGPKLAIVRKEFDLVVPQRKKTLKVKVTRPTGSSKLPVIVWSHGMYGSHENYKPLVEHWAQNGYLVVQTSHSDSLKHGTLAKKGSTSMAAMTLDWRNRPQDVSSLIDALSTHPELKAYADLSKVGVGGHSYGAHTTMLVSGAKPRTGQSYADFRAKAFLAISPQGEGKNFNQNSWQSLRGPILFVSGDKDDSSRGFSAADRRQAFERSPQIDKALYWVTNAEHSFGGIGRPMSGDKDQPDQVELVKSASLLFWDAKLKRDPQALRHYQSGLLSRQASGQATWTAR